MVSRKMGEERGSKERRRERERKKKSSFKKGSLLEVDIKWEVSVFFGR